MNLQKFNPTMGRRSNCDHDGSEDVYSVEKVEMEETRKKCSKIFEKHNDE